MAEWSKALVLGTSLYGGVGSNPTTAILFYLKGQTFFKKMEMQGIEPRTSRMQSERSTTELHPRIYSQSAAMAEWLRRWT